jgi:two-component system heavy metal sensor histidine kinase CusS
VARWWRDDKAAHRVVVAAYEGDRAAPRRATIVLALDVSHEAAVLGSFRATIFGAIAGASVIAAVFGFLIARRALRPVVRIANTASHITAQHLRERLDPAGAPHELSTLVTAFNTMLARLQESFGRLSEFSADLAHELRRPLTNLLARIQVVLSHSRSAEEYREALEASVEDVEQLSALVTDMLFLAQADNAQAALGRERVDLRIEGEALAEYFGTVAEERGICIKVEGCGAVEGDRQKLRRVLANLLSNAIRHSPDNESIVVAINSTAAGMVTLAVTDHGPGIPAKHQPRIFDRFYRADASRARHSGGTGLGLAIARSIVQLHGGDIRVTSEPGDTTFEVTLPSVPADGGMDNELVMRS